MSEQPPASRTDRVLLFLMFAAFAATLITPYMLLVSVALLLLILLRLAVRRSSSGTGSQLTEVFRKIPRRTLVVLVVASIGSVLLRTARTNATVAVVGVGVAAAVAVAVSGRIGLRRDQRRVD